MNYLNKLHRYSRKCSLLLKGCVSPKLFDRVTGVFNKQSHNESENSSIYRQYYQESEPIEVVRTQLRRKVPSFDGPPLSQSQDCQVQDTKIAKLNIVREQPEIKWFFDVIAGAQQGRRYLATTQEVKIGRKSDNHICLKDPKVSRYHAVIRLDGIYLVLKDMESTNGTYVNGEKIKNEQRLFAGDRFKVGDTVIQIISEL